MRLYRRRLGAAVLEGKRRGEEGTTRGAAVVLVRARHSTAAGRLSGAWVSYY